jgi:hypothetical protein
VQLSGDPAAWGLWNVCCDGIKIYNTCFCLCRIEKVQQAVR